MSDINNSQRVYIAQLLCPRRHCILGVAGLYDDEADAKQLALELGKQTALLIESGAIVPTCALCGAGEFSIDIGVTRFTTMEEAVPELKRLEREMALARLTRGREQVN